MAKQTSHFICQSCGAIAPKWAGRCDACSSWNSIVEEASIETTPKGLTSGKGRKIELTALDDKAEDARRATTGIGELDRVLGGGLVAGSAVLIGGDPGIGKSTLLLQTVVAVTKKRLKLRLYLRRGIGGANQLARQALRPIQPQCPDRSGDLGARHHRHA